MKQRFCAAFVVLLCNLGAAPDVSAQDLVIANARIIVGNGQVIDRGSVVVRAGRLSLYVYVQRNSFIRCGGAQKHAKSSGNGMQD